MLSDACELQPDAWLQSEDTSLITLCHMHLAEVHRHRSALSITSKLCQGFLEVSFASTPRSPPWLAASLTWPTNTLAEGVSDAVTCAFISQSVPHLHQQQQQQCQQQHY